MRTRSYVGDPYWLTLRYPATCAKCGHAIKRGERAFYFKTGHIFCVALDCGEAEASAFHAAAADEDFTNGSY